MVLVLGVVPDCVNTKNMFKRTTINKYGVLLAVAGFFVAVFFLFNRQSDKNHIDLVDAPEDQTSSGELVESEGIQTLESNKQLFAHPHYGFSLIVSDDLAIARYSEGQATETILIEPKDGNEDLSQPRFQMFVTPYLENIITEDRIKKDISSGVVQEPTEIKIGANRNIPALMFKSSDPVLGDTREVWFLQNGYLFEVTTSLQHDAWLAHILDTLQF